VRRRIGSALLMLAAIGLGGVSLAIVVPTPGIGDRVGRHLLAGALANLSVSILLLLIAAIPIRAGQRWGFWAYAVPFLVYGLPVLLVDATHVSRDRLIGTLAPQVIGIALGVAGLALSYPGDEGTRA
jgi:hypothetical protein